MKSECAESRRTSSLLPRSCFHFSTSGFLPLSFFLLISRLGLNAWKQGTKERKKGGYLLPRLGRKGPKRDDARSHFPFPSFLPKASCRFKPRFSFSRACGPTRPLPSFFPSFLFLGRNLRKGFSFFFSFFIYFRR